jgi:hypothetical protein
VKVEYDPNCDIINIELISNMSVAESVIEVMGVKKRALPQALETTNFTVVRES